MHIVQQCICKVKIGYTPKYVIGLTMNNLEAVKWHLNVTLQLPLALNSPTKLCYVRYSLVICDKLRFVANVDGSCSLYDIITLWPDMTRPILFSKSCANCRESHSIIMKICIPIFYFSTSINIADVRNSHRCLNRTKILTVGTPKIGQNIKRL